MDEAPTEYVFRPPISESDSLYDQIMEARDAGRANPLKAGLEYPLDLEIPQQHPGARPVPRLSAGGSTARDPVVLSLKDPLQTRVGYLSQVWTAEVVGASQVSLVMKIIQPSWCRFPWREDSYEAYDFAHNEAWAYRNMAHLQGLSIPYFFGLFEIQTPSGEAAWALVLEFIPGRTVNEVAASRCKEDIQAFCELGVAAIRDLAEQGWFLDDIRGPNFILTGQPGAWTVVIIDLFNATNWTPTLEGVGVQMHTFFSEYGICVRGVYPGIYRWAEEGLPKAAWWSPGYNYEEHKSQTI